jgi:hypothetical protein
MAQEVNNMRNAVLVARYASDPKMIQEFESDSAMVKAFGTFEAWLCHMMTSGPIVGEKFRPKGADLFEHRSPTQVGPVERRDGGPEFRSDLPKYSPAWRAEYKAWRARQQGE